VSILEELKWRGLIADCTDAVELAKRVAAPVTLYCGFDPTADSLHVGNLVPLLALRRFQWLGHHPIAVAGGATGSIGDPSGKTQERQLLTKEVLERNIASVKEQLKRLLDFEAKTNPARLVDNASWTAVFRSSIFCATSGSIFRSTRWWPRKHPRPHGRPRGRHQLHRIQLHVAAGVRFFGAVRETWLRTADWRQRSMGQHHGRHDLIRKKLGKAAYGLTLPLITNADGTKFGKTEAGAIWLDPKRTSVYKFYQFWINTNDRDVIRYSEIFHVFVEGRN
jgi:tyrosyl-tRNA synthetase